MESKPMGERAVEKPARKDTNIVYRVWYRDDSQPEIEKIPNIEYCVLKHVTLDVLVRSTRELTITHMGIRGDIPPVDKIAPHIKYLKLRDIPNADELESIGKLTNLEELDLFNNTKLQSLPDSIGDIKSLKTLDVSSCNLNRLPESIGKLANLEKLVLFNNENLRSLPDSIGDIKSLKKLHVAFCYLTRLPESIGKLTNLEELDMSGNRQLQSLPDSIGDIKSLKKLNVTFCNLTRLPERIGKLTNLKELDLSGNQELQSLPGSIGDIKSLKKLTVTRCNLTRLPESIGRLTNLEELNLYDNNKLQSLPDSIGDIKSLKKLNVSGCNLTRLPESIGKLTNLEDSDLSGNRQLQSLPDSIGDIKSLKKLNVSHCNLTRLPESIGKLTNLEELNLWDNNTLQLLPDSIGDIKSLKRLNVSHCNQTKLPESLMQLANLEKLDVNSNERLANIPHGVFGLRRLMKLNCDRCESLTSPPYAVCKQGIDAVREYIKALKEGEGKNKRVFPVVVIGQSMAGKTSLVQSLQENKRILTYRLGESKLDQATKVFKVREVKHGDDITILFYDCGGQAIYHYAYQLTFRAECVVLLVIDIAEFGRIADSVGIEAACKRTMLDWLSHVYIACPKASHPTIALTHIDQVSSEVLDERKTQLIEYTEHLRRIIIQHETLVGDESSPFFTMKSFCDTSRPLIHPDMIHEFSSSSGEQEINKLREELSRVGKSLLTDVPGSWYRMINYMTLNEAPLLSLSDLEKEFPQDDQHFILQYVHEIGNAFWFRKNPNLNNVVFHRVDILTKMIGILFDHTIEDVWKERLRKFVPFKYQHKVVELRKYKDLICQFNNTGIMDSSLLTNLMERESQLPPATAIEVLKLLNIICGPMNDGRSYIIPYFSTEHITVIKEKDHVQLKATVFLNGLPVPVYAYPLVSADYIDRHLTPFNRMSIQCGENGVRVEGDGTIKYLLHEPGESSITLITSTPVSKLCESLSSQLSTLQKLTEYLSSTWKAVRVEAVFYCSHCVLMNSQHVASEVDPEWLTQRLQQNTQHTTYSGHETFVCMGRGQRERIPRPLLYPCTSIDSEGESKLSDYISSLVTPHSNAESALTSLQARTGAVSTRMEQRDIDQIVQIIQSGPALIEIEPEPVDQTITADNEAEYKTTETRGRALIISNHYNGTRAGSEHDYSNIERMLQKFGFVTTGGHRDHTAKEIIEQINKEAQLPIHNNLDAFVLVITSHGDEGTVVGSDGTHIKLTDVYNLLSAKNFPAMRGKPKLIIIQACRGSKREMLLDEATQLPQTSHTPHTGGNNLASIRTQTDDIEPDSTTEDMSTADLLIMQSSFDTFSSPRSPRRGSPFIRAIVAAFYKFAHKCHAETLAEMVRAAVSQWGVERTDELRAMRLAHPERAYVASMPKTVCTFTELRRLYLRPDARTENHHRAITHPVSPRRSRPTSRVESLIVTETCTVERQGQVLETKEIKRIKFNIRRN